MTQDQAMPLGIELNALAEKAAIPGAQSQK